MFPKEILILDKEHLSNDQIILSILRQVDIPLPFNFIRNLLNLPKGQVFRILASLEKYGLVKKSTCSKATFYVIKS